MPFSNRPDRSQVPGNRDIPDPDSDDDTPARSVEFMPGPEPVCQAMRALAGKRLLSQDAPLLPLPGCTEPTCQCRYKLLSDRRSGVRRWGEVGFKLTESRYQQPFVQRRSTLPGRRKTDHSRDDS